MSSKTELDPGAKRTMQGMWYRQARQELDRRLSAAEMLKDEGNDKFSEGEYADGARGRASILGVSIPRPIPTCLRRCFCASASALLPLCSSHCLAPLPLPLTWRCVGGL